MTDSVKFELIEWEGKPSVMFEDGDIYLQNDSLGSFLMHVGILMPECKLPLKLEIKEARSFKVQSPIGAGDVF